ncbi:MAG: zf-HC2 domain-containing protein, partial [Verrucomicrobiales bacterium]|nr:zf-HC2 domain-containing protein [Verrucomicrobiales bacterium]
MKHPESPEWMAFVYGEADARSHAELQAHLQECPECVARVARWRGTMEALDTAEVPARPAMTRRWTAWTFRAAAAAIVLAIGFALGRSGGVSDRELKAHWDDWRAETSRALARQREDDLRRFAAGTLEQIQDANARFVREFVDEYRRARLEDRHDMARALWALDRRNAADTARLEDGLAVLASSTGTGFEEA